MKKQKLNKFLRIFISLVILSFPYVVSQQLANATLSSYRDTIDDSRPSNETSHEILFITSQGVQVDETITLTFDSAGSNFNFGSVGFADIDLAEDDDAGCDGTWSEKTLQGTADAANWGVALTTSPDVITFTAPSAGTPITGGRCVQIEIGDNATGGGTNNEITNPGSGSIYDIDIGGTFGETGTMKVAIVATITAQVTVDETLTFTVSATTAANCPNRSDSGGEVDSTAVLVDFDSVNSDTFYDACQELDVSTNAADGYTVTVTESDQLTYGVETIADGTCDSGTCSETSWGTWATNTNNGFAYCVEDITGTDANALAGEQCDDATPEFKVFPELDVDVPDAQTVMSNSGSATSDIYFGYRLSVDGTQPAGVYQNNIIFICTPTY